MLSEQLFPIPVGRAVEGSSVETVADVSEQPKTSTCTMRESKPERMWRSRGLCSAPNPVQMERDGD